MTIGLYAATIPAWLQQLGAISRLMDKAQAWCAEQGTTEAALVDARLIADMLPLGYQVKSCIGHSLDAIQGVREGEYTPDRGGWPQNLGGLKAKIDDAITALTVIDPAEIDGFEGRDMAFVLGEMRMDFTAEDFLLSFSAPNLYFHAATAYDILRAQGVPLGKRDFMGALRVKR